MMEKSAGIKNTERSNIYLNNSPFFRTHKSWLVNLDYAIRYIKGEGGDLVMNGGMEVPVSRNRKDELLKFITHLQV